MGAAPKEQSRVGRVPEKERMTFDQLLSALDEYFGWDAEEHGHLYKKNYLYKLSSQKKITNYGTAHRALFNPAEVIEFFEEQKR